jgi:hypothetical protein
MRIIDENARDIARLFVVLDDVHDELDELLDYASAGHHAAEVERRRAARARKAAKQHAALREALDA